MKHQKITVPGDAGRIAFRNGELRVPDRPVLPFIEGDGIGADITPPVLTLVDNAVGRAYRGRRTIAWTEVLAGEKAKSVCGDHLPDETVRALKDLTVSLKGPLTTPMGAGFRSLDVLLARRLGLYARVRSVEHFEGVDAPVREPSKLNVVIFSENTEDAGAGYEWPARSVETATIMTFLKENFGIELDDTSAIGLKTMSETASKRLVRAAVRHLVRSGRKSLTLVHKGNVMKCTEGAFRTWGYEVCLKEFAAVFITEKDLRELHGGVLPEGKFVVKDRFADAMFQQTLTRPGDFDVIAVPGLTGDSLSDACAAQVGGGGMAPGACVGDGTACFGAYHGSAPRDAGLNRANPSSLVLSAVMMLEYIGWREAAALLRAGLGKAILGKKVTVDLAGAADVEPLSTTGFIDAIAEKL
jgi:isocitrate dehydrogenase